MKLFKWWVLPAAAVAVLVLLAGCEKPDEDAFTGSERARLRDNAEREKASQSLTSALLKTSQALALAQNGIQLKLQGVATLDGQAARLEPPPAPPAATTPGAPPAEPKAPETGAAPGAAPTEGAKPSVGAAAEGQAAATAPAAPQPPKLVAQGTLANQMIEQAFALLETVKTDAAPILTGRYANEPRIQSLKELLAVAEHMILAGAKMEPAAKDVAELIAEQERKAAESAKPAETAPASVEGEKAKEGAAPTAPTAPAATPAEGEKAKEGAAPAEPAAGAEAPKLGAPLPNMLTPRGPAAGH